MSILRADVIETNVKPSSCWAAASPGASIPVGLLDSRGLPSPNDHRRRCSAGCRWASPSRSPGIRQMSLTVFVGSLCGAMACRFFLSSGSRGLVAGSRLRGPGRSGGPKPGRGLGGFGVVGRPGGRVVRSSLICWGLAWLLSCLSGGMRGAIYKNARAHARAASGALRLIILGLGPRFILWVGVLFP